MSQLCALVCGDGDEVGGGDAADGGGEGEAEPVRDVELEPFLEAHTEFLRYLDVVPGSALHKRLMQARALALQIRNSDPENYDSALEYVTKKEIQRLCLGPLRQVSNTHLLREVALVIADFMVCSLDRGLDPGEELLRAAKAQGWQPTVLTQRWAERQAHMVELLEGLAHGEG